MNTLDPPSITRRDGAPGTGPPRQRSGPEGPPRVAAAKQASTGIVAPDPYGIRLAARERISRLDWQRRISSELEQLASLVAYYGSRRPRAVPLVQFLAEGWWAA